VETTPAIQLKTKKMIPRKVGRKWGAGEGNEMTISFCVLQYQPTVIIEEDK
jgi:hypothetical protein